MRKAFFGVIEEASRTRKDLMVLTADLGFGLFDGIRQQCSDRFYDVGVAEANMIGLASGLSLCGKNVYCYSIIPFLTMRAYEQVRVDVAHHNLNVKLVGVGGGFAYGLEGFTHFGLEDIAIMRALPNMSIVAPADPCEARCVAEVSLDHDGPLYVRLGKAGDPPVHEGSPDFKLGKAIVMREGRGAAIIATGSMVHTALSAWRLLAERSVEVTLIDMHTIKPLDKEIVEQVAAAHDIVFCVEEHLTEGGVGSAVAEVMAGDGSGCKLRRIGIDGGAANPVGCADYLRESHGLSPARLAGAVIEGIRGT